MDVLGGSSYVEVESLPSVRRRLGHADLNRNSACLASNQCLSTPTAGFADTAS